MESAKYPQVSSRVKAMVLDYGLILGAAIIFNQVLDAIGLELVSVRIALYVVILMYDPVMVAFTGGTIGHKVFDLKVKRISNEDKNVLFPLAVVRFVLKAFLGWISFLSIGASSRNLAIHDALSGSIVLYKKPQNNLGEG